MLAHNFVLEKLITNCLYWCSTNSIESIRSTLPSHVSIIQPHRSKSISSEARFPSTMTSISSCSKIKSTPSSQPHLLNISCLHYTKCCYHLEKKKCLMAMSKKCHWKMLGSPPFTFYQCYQTLLHNCLDITKPPLQTLCNQKSNFWAAKMPYKGGQWQSSGLTYG